MKEKRENNKGQLTIFIIAAILIIAMVALFFAIPKLRTAVGIEKPESPEKFIQTCLEDAIKENVDIISRQGGSMEPSPNILYQDEKLQYLCYTNEYLKPCTTHIPFLREHIEDEIKNSIQEDVGFCFTSLKQTYEKNNYQANFKEGEIIVELLPQRIVTTMDYEFTFSKGDTTERRETFRIVVNNNLYELVAIAQNIMDREIRYGDADTTYYMDLYSDLKVEKEPLDDDTRIYTLTNKESNDKFQFAIRSIAFPFIDEI